MEERGGFRLYGALRIGQKVWPFGRPESQEKGDAEKGEEAKEEKKEEKGKQMTVLFKINFFNTYYLIIFNLFFYNLKKIQGLLLI